ncbi:CMP-N-acetylneuraminate-beta-galactosamide-alpha-2,3-sialyltransferase 2-like [Discoglossus pictus]
MSYVRLCCRVIHHKRIAWIPPMLCLVVFVIYFSFFMEYSSPVERVGDVYGSTCMCGRCRPEKRQTEWFNAHFNGTVNPILTGKDHKIPEVVQKWWLNLQGSNNASHIPEILDQMFKVIPSGNPYEEKENRPCRTCAVVGNSGNLKGSKFGMKIDSHGLILR